MENVKLTNTDTDATTAAKGDEKKPVIADFTKTIWVSKKEPFEKKVEHLNKILKRHGKRPITYKFENYRTIPVEFTLHVKGDAFRNDRTETRHVEVCDVHCTGWTQVKKDDNDYTFLGIVSYVEGVKQVFCNNEEYARFFMDDFRDHFCDHCKTRRTNRKAYFMFLNPADGKVLQIGSTCAKEYFGIDSSAFLETYGNTFLVEWDGSEEELGDFNRGSVAYSFADIAPVVSMSTNGYLKWNKRDDGFVDPKAPIHEWPTVEAVEMVVRSWDSWDPIYPAKGDCENAKLISYEEALDFWEKKYEKEESVFAYNCREAVKAGHATSRSLGAFCWAIFAAYNAKVREIRDREAAEAAMKNFVPCAYAEGSRQTIRGTITNIRTFEAIRPNSENFRNNYWGEEMTKWVVDFTEVNGTLYHFTTSAAAFADFRNGDKIEMRCTIGDTKPFKGVPYTHVSRPKAAMLANAEGTLAERKTA